MHIYLVTNLENDKQYVGASRKKIPNPTYFGSGKLIREALQDTKRKFRIDKSKLHNYFRKEILEKCNSEEELYAREDFWIKKLGTISPHGYNIAYKGSRAISNKVRRDDPLAIGKRYGNWTIVGGTGINRRAGEIQGRKETGCVCDCGEVFSVNTYSLLNGKTTQCKKCAMGNGPTSASFANKVYRSVIGTRQDYNVTPTNLMQTYMLQSETCALTGEEIPHRRATAIRWDNNQGFVPGNTLITSKDLQKTIGNMDGQTFLNLCQKVIQHNPKKKLNNIQDFFNKRAEE